MEFDQIAKLLLKLGAKAAAPVAGDLIVMAAEGVGGMLIDDHVAAEARESSERILNRIEKRFVDISVAEGTDKAQALAQFARIAELIGKHPPEPADWQKGAFSPPRAADAYFRRIGNAAKALQPMDRELMVDVISDLFEALGREQSTFNELERQFRTAVIDQLSAMPEALVEEIKQHSREAATVAALALVELPVRKWRSGLSPPGALLRADIDQPVPFHGREEEIKAIEEWCDAPVPIAVRLYTGAGGMGKSRLLIEACANLAAKGWRAGFIGRSAADIAPGAFDLLMRQARLLVVLDYAETQRDLACALLRAAFHSASESKLRIVLIARAAEEWWEGLKNEPDGVGDLLRGPATDWVSLRPLAPGRKERLDSYLIARDHFADLLDRRAITDLPTDLDEPCYRAALLLHMRALAAVEQVPVKGDQGILDYMVGREKHYWLERARQAGISEVIAPTIGQAMAAVTLGGGVATEADALALLKSIPRLCDQPAAMLGAIGDVLHQMYPGERWIEPVQPDLLGEHLVETELGREPETLVALVFGEADDGRA